MEIWCGEVLVIQRQNEKMGSKNSTLIIPNESMVAMINESQRYM